MDVCILCTNADKTDTVLLTVKGAAGIKKAASLRGDDIEVNIGQRVHVSCRRDYTNKNCITACKKEKAKSSEECSKKRKLRSETSPFCFQKCCIFCGHEKKVQRLSKKLDVVVVRTLQFQETIRGICLERNDDWGMNVLSRLEYARDCHASDVVYHRSCSSNFRTMRPIPISKAGIDDEPLTKRAKAGRPEIFETSQAFNDVMRYLEAKDDEGVTVRHLVDKMEEFLRVKGSSAEVYSVRYMKKKLLDFYGNRVTVSEVDGKSDIVTFTDTASTILYHFSSLKQADEDDRKEEIIRTAANLIKSDVKKKSFNSNFYPTTDDIRSIVINLEFLPESLKHFLENMIVSSGRELKVASIGQAIMQGIRPRTLMPPLQVALGVQLHHQFGSRNLIDSLNQHGFCTSYSEVKKFEANAAVAHGKNIPVLKEGQFAQFIGDNVDHNTRTLDGKHTFHGMGLLAAITPGQKNHGAIPRLSPNLEDVISMGKIELRYHQECYGFPGEVFRPLTANRFVSSDTDDVDELCKMTWAFSKSLPSWSGVMQSVLSGQHPGKSDIVFLPIIDMNPSDSTCIYSTLLFICQQARLQKISPVITFDQPLFWKASCIIANEPPSSPLRDVVMRLGPFHTEMSFVGCIGHLMQGSGLRELLEEVYAPNTVTYILTGKAIARAVRGHFLVDASLHKLLLLDALQDSEQVNDHEGQAAGTSTECPSGEKDEIPVQIRYALFVMERLLKNTCTPEEVSLDPEISGLRSKLQVHIGSLQGQKTALLWLQYMDMVDIIRMFLKSERMGNFKLHLESIKRMIPFFAACGHNNYTKSAMVYIHNMEQLQTKNPTVYKSLCDGCHVVRISDRYWAGLSTDLIIEQVLVKSLKTQGGLTRGRGLNESQRVLWTLSMSACADFTAAMQEIAKTAIQPDVHHKDTRNARRQRDAQDIDKFFNLLVSRNPFHGRDTLRCITTGEESNKFVNAHIAKEIGLTIVDQMVDSPITTFSFKRKNQVVTMVSKDIRHGDEDIHIDQQLLFQRLVTMADKMNTSNVDVFKYELCSYPPSLFSANGLPLEPNKSSLCHYLWNDRVTPSHTPPTELPVAVQYVLDGGALLQKIHWPRGSTYASVLKMYTEHVTRKYGSAIVVFDGYGNQPSLKDMTHMRRNAGITTKRVEFVEDMVITLKKEAFLANSENKQKIINHLGEALEKAQCKVYHSVADADVDIVIKAVESSLTNPTAVIGSDTDLLVLLLHHAIPKSHKLLFAPEIRASSKEPRRIWDIQIIKSVLGEQFCKYLIFCHSFSGCDTTSRIFGLSKSAMVKKLDSTKEVAEAANIFTQSSCKQDVITAGECAMFQLFNGPSYKARDLDHLRYLKFKEKTSVRSTCVSSTCLPPTSAATKYHSLRSYLQVQQWMNNNCNLDPLEYGWELKKGKLYPKFSDLQPAPLELLQTVRCSCKSDCTSFRCTCKKNGLNCSPACRECRGTACFNGAPVEVDENFEDNFDLDNDLAEEIES